MRVLPLLFFTLMISFQGFSQSSSIDEAVKTLVIALNTGDTATFNQIIPSPALFKELYLPDSLNLAAMSEEDQQFTLSMDYSMMHKTVFTIEAMKFKTFQLNIDTATLKFEKERFLQPMRALKQNPETYFISIPLDHEQFKWLQFSLSKVGGFWYSLAPYYSASKTRKKLD